MDQKIQDLLGLVIIGILILGVAAAFWYVYSFANSTTVQRSFQVTGEGKVVAVPDVAEVTVGVLTEGGKDLNGLQNENAEKINRVIAFLKEEGVDSKDIKTQYYNISPRYQFFSCQPIFSEEVRSPEGVASCPPSEIIGYSISQNITVKVRDLNKAGDVLAGVVERGANNVSGPNFTIDNPDELQQQAREEAITKAKAKAQAIANSGGFRLGKLIYIQEGFSPMPMYGFEAIQMKADGVGGGVLSAPAVEPGSQEITVTVTLSYEIK